MTRAAATRSPSESSTLLSAACIGVLSIAGLSCPASASPVTVALQAGPLHHNGSPVTVGPAGDGPRVGQKLVLELRVVDTRSSWSAPHSRLELINSADFHLYCAFFLLQYRC